MKLRCVVLLGGLYLTFLTAPVVGHHSAAAMYNTQVSITIIGSVKKFEWTNPHAFIYLEVQDPATGNLVEWEVEMMSLNHLRTMGWTSKIVKPGDIISCMGSPAKSGARSMFATHMKLADGRDIRS